MNQTVAALLAAAIVVSINLSSEGTQPAGAADRHDEFGNAKAAKKKRGLKWNRRFVPVAHHPFVATTLQGTGPPIPSHTTCQGLLEGGSPHGSLGWQIAGKPVWVQCSSLRGIANRFVAERARREHMPVRVGRWRCYWRKLAGDATCRSRSLKIKIFEPADIFGEFGPVRKVGDRTITGLFLSGAVGESIWRSGYGGYLVVGRRAHCKSSAIGSELAFGRHADGLLFARRVGTALANFWGLGDVSAGTYTACIHVQRTGRDRRARYVASTRVEITQADLNGHAGSLGN